MTPSDLASILNGREYRIEISDSEEALAKAAGLVVVFGASDDLMEFRGAIDDELSAYDGTTARVSPTGLIPSWESVDKEDEDAAEAYFKAKLGGYRKIEALWDPGEDYSWKFSTDIPHATFEIVEDGEPYCRGIVFKLADAAPPRPEAAASGS